jgi:hypothetical protein
MTRATSILAAALAAFIGLTAHAQAQAVPGEMSFTARISDGNGPVTGALNLKFEIFTDATAGTSQWEETQTGIVATDGMLYAMIGANTPLDASILDGGPLFLEVTVGSDTMSPRIALASVPYAIRADTAATAEHATTADTLGTLGPGDVLPKGSTLSCNATTQKVTAINPTTGNVTCSTDQNTTYSLSCTDVSVTGPAGTGFRYATANCAAGFIVTGGGCNFSGGSGITSRYVRGHVSGNGYYCTRYNESQTDQSAVATARCCRLQ